MLHARVYANTFCESFFISFDALPCSSALIPCTVAMLNAREALKEELQMKSIVTSGFEVYNYNSFQVSRKEADGERDATEVPPSARTKTIRGEICGHIRIHADSSRPEGCSNCYMTL